MVSQWTRWAGPATIVQGEHSATVDCFIELSQSAGLKDWGGIYENAPIESEPKPGEAELHIHGAVGTIIVTGSLAGTGQGRFQGSGEPPNPR